MNLALGALALWVGGALIWVATHDTGAANPWQVYRQLTDAIAGRQP